MVDYCAAEENGHENNGARSCIDGEESDEADFGEVDACHELLEDFGVGGAFGVDIVGEDVEGVVADC